jgi:alkyl sulfatase BDS1-like metallo-beta-lactamase superfamily hydrolase
MWLCVRGRGFGFGRRSRASLLIALLVAGASCRQEEPAAPAAPAETLPGGLVPPRYSRIVGGSGKNLAYDRAAATIDPRLTEHSGKMAQAIYQTAGNVYSAVGYGLANMTMIEGSDGVVIVDTLEAVENARAVMDELRKITTKPVKAIIYTHNHYDHVMGTLGVVTPEEVDSGAVPIYAHERLLAGMLNQLGVVGEAVGRRSLYTFGNFLDKGPEGSVNEGIGPALVAGAPSFVPPTVTFADQLEIGVAGLRLQLLYAPSETDDEIVVWMPETGVLQSAEVIQGETFPNLYTIRGTTYRDPVQWYRTIDRLRALAPEYLVPSHGRPVEGRAEVESLLSAYRDAIQFTHDQAVRLINRGHTPDELAEALPALPPHLAAHPWVAEFYGTVKHSVRNFYVGYLGWFEGDPTFLDPLPPAERAARTVKLMGGRDAVLAAAREAYAAGDFRWTAELLTPVIRIARTDMEARQLKAEALRQLGLRQMNINWRNFYLTAALELEDALDTSRFDLERGLAIFSRLPLVHLLRNLVCRVDAEKSREVHMTLALQVTDKQQAYALELRRGVVQLHEKLPERVDLTLAGNEATLRDVLLGRASFTKEWLLRGVRVDGALSDVARFFSYFERASETLQPVVVR